MNPAWLVVEFLVIFVGLPLAFRFAPRPGPALPALWVVACYCFLQLRRDGSFDRAVLWRPGAVEGQAGSILFWFLLGAAGLWLLVWRFAPGLQFRFVRKRPRVWAALMVIYPVLSVYPQGVVYRAFLMHRYAGLVPGMWGMILLSAAAFAFMHLVFRNWIAVVLTFVGGVLFAWRYEVTGSLLTSSVEHALYGCWLFTVGLGDYFYHRSMRPKDELVAVAAGE